MSDNPLAVKLYDVLIENSSGRRNIVALIDGSGSIAAVNFELMIKGLEALNEATVTSDSYLSIVQFSDIQIEHCPMINEKNNIARKITDIKQRRGNTKTADGFKYAINALTTLNGSKYILLFTDGFPSTPQDYPNKEIDICKSMGIKVFAIGIGEGINEDALNTMCTDNMFFSCKTFVELKIALEMLKSADLAKASKFLHLDVYPSSLNMSVGQPMTLLIRLLNKNPDQVFPAGIEIEFLPNRYFKAAILKTKTPILPEKELKQEIVLYPHAYANEDDYPGEIEFEYTIDRLKRKGCLTLGTGFLRGNYARGYPINCLMFGHKGTGKTAFVNGILTCLSMKQRVQKFLLAIDSPEHVTNNYQKIWIGGHIGEEDQNEDIDNFDLNADEKNEINSSSEKISLQLFDPWGDADKEYLLINIQHLIEGQILPGIHRKDSSRKIQPINELNRIHCIVFIIPMGSIDDNDTMESNLKTIRIVTSLNITPLIVVTRIDDFEKEEDRAIYKSKILKKLPVGEALVHFHANYHNQKFRDNQIDLSTRRILNSIYQMAKDQIEQLGGKQYLIRNKAIFKNETILDIEKGVIKSTVKINPTETKVTESGSLQFLNSEYGLSNSDISKLEKYGVKVESDLNDLDKSDFASINLEFSSPLIKKRFIKKYPNADVSNNNSNTTTRVVTFEDILKEKGVDNELVTKIKNFGISNMDDFNDVKAEDLDLRPLQYKQLKKKLGLE